MFKNVFNDLLKNGKTMTITHAKNQKLVTNFFGNFPLLTEIQGCFGCCLDERIPPFLGFILSIAENSPRTPCCIILPGANRIAQLTAVILALSRLKKNYRKYLVRHATERLIPGQRVKVLPGGHVFEYIGLWPGNTDFFQLASTTASAKTQGTRTFPVDQIVRLEPTKRKAPKGGLKTILEDPEPEFIDTLTGITSFGNTSIYDNNVLLLGSRKDFLRMLTETWLFRYEGKSGYTKSSAFLPWGSIEPDGSLKLLGPKQDSGIPLVAVSSFCENIAAACENAEPFSKTVIACSPARLASNLQCYDTISECQNLIVISERNHLDDLRILGERESHIWDMEPREILAGGPPPDNTVRISFVGRAILSACNRQNRKISSKSCGRGLPGDLSQSIYLLSQSSVQKDAGDIVGELKSRMFDVLMLISGWLMEPDEEELQILAGKAEPFREEFSARRAFLEDDVRTQISECLGKIYSLVNKGPLEWKFPKGEIILNRLSTIPEGICAAAAAGTGRSRSSLEKFMAESGFHNIPCYQTGSIPGNRDFDVLLLTTWPGSHRLSALLNRYNVREICLVGYEHELLWLDSFLKKRKRELQDACPDSKIKASLTGIPEELFSNDNRTDNFEQTGNRHSDFVFELENRFRAKRPVPGNTGSGEEKRSALFVRFYERPWAYLTEGHKVPCLNSVLDQESGGRSHVFMKKSHDIRSGDYLMFREGGERHIIEGFARYMAGENKYNRLRNQALLWKKTIAGLGKNPDEVKKRLAEAGLKRTLATVRSWLYHDSTIGPGSLDDLRLMAEAARDRDLADNLESTWSSISGIRSLHMKAGMELTRLLIKLVSNRQLVPTGSEMNVSLTIGNVWIVQVDFIGKEEEQVPSSLVNRLMWDEEQ